VGGLFTPATNASAPIGHCLADFIEQLRGRDANLPWQILADVVPDAFVRALDGFELECSVAQDADDLTRLLAIFGRRNLRV
jgi:hypothetical protein